VAPLTIVHSACDGGCNGSWWSDLHGHTLCSGVQSSHSVTGTLGGTDSRLWVRCSAALHGEAAGLDPAGLHYGSPDDI
jgi:hypothetical protein